MRRINAGNIPIGVHAVFDMFMIMTATAAIMVMMMSFFMSVTMFTAVVMAFLTVV